MRKMHPLMAVARRAAGEVIPVEDVKTQEELDAEKKAAEKAETDKTTADEPAEPAAQSAPTEREEQPEHPVVAEARKASGAKRYAPTLLGQAQKMNDQMRGKPGYAR